MSDSFLGFSQQIVLRACDVDYNERWKPSAMFTAMQEIAELHCIELGYPRSALVERGIVWLLLRVRLEVDAYPRMGDAVVVRTWTGKTNRALFPRYFDFSVGGRRMGCASTQWMLVDVKQHRMAMPAAYGLSIDPQGEAPVPDPQRLRFTAAPDSAQQRRVAYSDLDVNKHMNNARYIEWALDLFPAGRFEGKAIRSLQINYHSEAKPGELLALELAERDGGFSIRGVHEDGVSSFDVAGEWSRQAL